MSNKGPRKSNSSYEEKQKTFHNSPPMVRAELSTKLTKDVTAKEGFNGPSYTPMNNVARTALPAIVEEVIEVEEAEAKSSSGFKP